MKQEHGGYIQVNKYAYGFLNPTARCEKDEERFKIASNMAYGDMARHTLHTNLTDKEKENIKAEVCMMLKDRIDTLNRDIAKIETDASYFEKWHEDTCEETIALFKKIKNTTLDYGQAQKWLNMLIKYLYVYDMTTCNSFFESEHVLKALHVPIDSKVIQLAKDKLDIKKPSSWSKMSYTEYIEYQKKLRERIASQESATSDERIPFLWELIMWS